MGKTALFLGIAVLVLLIVISLLVPQLKTANKEVVAAQELSGTVKQLLRAIDVRCTAKANDFPAVSKCISPILRQNDFGTDTFRPFNEKRNETGVFVIVNEGAKTYNGSLFMLSKNGEELSSGCHIKTDILADYTCRFDLLEPCTEGDVYEITYGESRLVTKTC